MLSAKRMNSSDGILNSTSGKVIVDIDEDILTAILSKLPIKFLLRLKCVSKKFCNMISSPLFGCHYYQTNRDKFVVAGFLVYRLHSYHDPVYNFVFLHRRLTPRNPLCSFSFFDANSDILKMWSCKGLFCICIIKCGINSSSSYEYFICNPTTNKSIKLSDPDTRPLKSRVLSMNIAFDPETSPFYKVVCVWVGGNHYRCSIFSSDTKVWRSTSASWIITSSDAYLFTKGVFWNKSVHWISKVGPFLRFDLEKECFEMMPTTPIPRNQKKKRIKYFGESYGHLYLVEMHGYQSNFFHVFELKVDYSKWCPKYLFNLIWLQRFGIDHIECNIYWVYPVKANNSFVFMLSTPRGKYWIYVYRRRIYLGNLQHLRDQDPDYPEEYLSQANKFKWYNCHQYMMTLTAV